MGWHNLWYEFYRRAKSRIVPDLVHAQQKYYEILKTVFPEHAVWLDLGCGHQAFGDWMLQQERELAARSQRFVGLDAGREGLRRHRTLRLAVVGNGEALPFAAESFDIVTANMVTEHLERPGAVLREIHRVLRPGGWFVAHTPNRKGFLTWIASKLPQNVKNRLIWRLERREADDIFRTYYRFNTTAEIRKCASDCGWQEVQLHLIQSISSLWRLGPVVLLHLVLLRLLQQPRLAELRSNIVVCMTKEPEMESMSTECSATVLAVRSPISNVR